MKENELNYDSSQPMAMTIQAMIADDVINRYRDGNGGLLKYLSKVSKIVKEYKDEQYREIERITAK